MENLFNNLYVSLIAENRWEMYLTGLGNTLIIAAFATCFGFIIGLIVAITKYLYLGNKKLRLPAFICDIYLTVIRGTPVVIQLMIIYFSVFAFMTNGVPAAIIGFSINSGAYVSEVIRSGILSVGKGQEEAARSLGLNQYKTFRLVIFPQAIKNVIPALFNEFISLLKETSVAGMIAVPELTKVAGNIRGRAFVTTPLYIVGIIYLVCIVLITILQRKIEKSLLLHDKN